MDRVEVVRVTDYPMARFQLWMLLDDVDHDLLVGILEAVADGSAEGHTLGERQAAARCVELLRRAD